MTYNKQKYILLKQIFFCFVENNNLPSHLGQDVLSVLKDVCFNANKQNIYFSDSGSMTWIHQSVSMDRRISAHSVMLQPTSSAAVQNAPLKCCSWGADDLQNSKGAFLAVMGQRGQEGLPPQVGVLPSEETFQLIQAVVRKASQVPFSASQGIRM